jgi:dephospho-CoA kinase
VERSFTVHTHSARPSRHRVQRRTGETSPCRSGTSEERIAREGLRAGGDMAIYSKKILPKIQKAISGGYTKILLESMYNIYEYEYIKEAFPENFKVLAIHSDEDIRIKRINSRKERKLTAAELESRQMAEAKNLGKGTVISLANYHFLNNGDDMQKFEQEIDAYLKTRILNI